MTSTLADRLKPAFVFTLIASLLVMLPATAEDTPTVDDAPGVTTESEIVEEKAPAARTNSSSAESCSEPDGSGTRQCASIEHKTVESASKPKETGVSPQAIPSRCSTPGNWSISRFDACRIEGILYTVYRVSSTGVQTVIGTAELVAYSWTRTYNGAAKPRLEVEIHVVKTFGEATKSTISSRSACSIPGCTGSGRTSSPTLINAANSIFLIQEWGWNGPTGSVQTGSLTERLTFSHPTAPAATYSIQTPNIRCDNAAHGSASSGCIYPSSRPTVNYEAAAFPSFSDHVRKAQESGLPGSTASTVPLHRTRSQVAISANRNAACKSSYLRPVGKTCDEYPFASTREGASSARAFGRTFPGCRINLGKESSTGIVGFSVCMIDKADNSGAGTALSNSLYVPY